MAIIRAGGKWPGSGLHKRKGVKVPSLDEVASEYQINKMLRLITQNPFATPTQICQEAGVRRLAWEKVLETDERVKNLWNEAMLIRGDEISQAFDESGRKGQSAAALRRYCPEYNDKSTVKVENIDFESMSDEELQKLITDRAKAAH